MIDNRLKFAVLHLHSPLHTLSEDCIHSQPWLLLNDAICLYTQLLFLVEVSAATPNYKKNLVYINYFEDYKGELSYGNLNFHTAISAIRKPRRTCANTLRVRG